MVDREARKHLIDAMRKYVNEEVTAFDFDGLINGIQTQDQTVDWAVGALWSFYDDCRDHKIVGNKQDWDALQRLLLLLESDLEIEPVVRWYVTYRQWIAWAGLVVLASSVAYLGIQSSLLIVLAVLGLIADALIWRKPKGKTTPAEDAEARLLPFSSVSNLLYVRRRLPRFRKTQYPRHLEGRTIRTPQQERRARMFSILVSPFACPLLLLISAIPESQECSRVVQAGAERAGGHGAG